MPIQHACNLPATVPTSSSIQAFVLRGDRGNHAARVEGADQLRTMRVERHLLAIGKNALPQRIVEVPDDQLDHQTAEAAIPMVTIIEGDADMRFRTGGLISNRPVAGVQFLPELARGGLGKSPIHPVVVEQITPS